ncbi:MAG: RDD family protein [Gammaproteobacteria bacterium]|nr:RDD family protein [Gammaproteobacteria bacterium]NNF60280.1 RDD family protein [Gammaproteobacteria bacterium]NNM20388.1 RDD family protein [Gammaproteobacteria bacterium]
MTNTTPPGLLRRLAAICYDTLILAAVLIAATAAALLFTRGNAIEPGTLWYQGYVASIALAYYAGFWRFGGQTIGMVAWRLHVVAANGDTVTFLQAIWRALLAAVSWLAAGLGFWWVLIDREKRGWHDLLSGTRLEWTGGINAPGPTPPA